MQFCPCHFYFPKIFYEAEIIGKMTIRNRRQTVMFCNNQYFVTKHEHVANTCSAALKHGWRGTMRKIQCLQISVLLQNIACFEITRITQ